MSEVMVTKGYTEYNATMGHCDRVKLLKIAVNNLIANN